jgi:hypothetical protein
LDAVLDWDDVLERENCSRVCCSWR